MSAHDNITLNRLAQTLIGCRIEDESDCRMAVWLLDEPEPTEAQMRWAGKVVAREGKRFDARNP